MKQNFETTKKSGTPGSSQMHQIVKQRQFEALAQPVGQTPQNRQNDKLQKIDVRYEIDLSQKDKRQKYDVHVGTYLNPLVSKELNEKDPQIKTMLEKTNDVNAMDKGEADVFLDKFAKESLKTKIKDDVIESHQIEALMGALQHEQSYKVLEKICVQYRIQDVSEYNLDRLSQQYQLEGQGQKVQILTDANQTYQLFGKNQYLVSKMNPLQLSIIFDNLKALRYLSLVLNNHLRLSVNAPDINYGGLQIKESSQVQRECWPLFVAVNNKSLTMLMFIWQDLGNQYNTSAGTGYGNINSRVSLKLGQDKQLRTLGVKDFQDKQQRPLGPSSEQEKLKGNGNRCRLWDSTHFLALVQVLANERYADGLKFILSCQASHDIYLGMPLPSRLSFLKMLLHSKAAEQDFQIRELLKLKLTEAPFATLATFVMVQMDEESLENIKLRKQVALKKQQVQRVRGESIYQSFRSPTTTQRQQTGALGAPAQNNFKRVFEFVNQNQVHLEHAIENIDLDEFMKLKNYQNSKFYDQFVARNIDLVLKCAKKKDAITFMVVSRLKQRVNDLINLSEDRPNTSLITLLKESVNSWLNQEAVKKNWIDYEEIISRQLFYWAKAGETEQFIRAVQKFDITYFSRVKVTFTKHQRGTIARYHNAFQEIEVSSEGSDKQFEHLAQLSYSKRGSPNSKRERQNKMKRQEYDEFQHEYQLADVSPEIGLFGRSGMQAELTPLLIAIQYRHFDIVRFITEKMKVDVRMALTLVNKDNKQKEQSENLQISGHKFDLPQQINECSPEQVTYSLLIACSNNDILMLRYLWERYATVYWGLDNLRCLMQQLISQEWLEGIDLILESEVTCQMIKSLNANDRSNLIVDYFGNVFSQDFKANVRACLLNNFCQEPYAGSLIILLIEYFDELHSVKRKTSGGEIIVALGQNAAEAEQAFKRVWDSSLASIYPMEIQVLRETCKDKFTSFLETLDNTNKKQGQGQQRMDHRSQAIRMTQLLKGSSGYRGMLEPPENLDTDDSSDEIDTPANDLTRMLQQDDDLDFDYHYKVISNQTENFERAISKAPIPHQLFLKHVVYGNVTQLKQVIKTYDIDSQEILEMRGFDFVCPHLVEEASFGFSKKFKISAINWSPIHFAIFYKQIHVLKLLKKLFGSKMDLIWASSSPQQDIRNSKFLNKDGSKKQNKSLDIFEDNPQLYGLYLAILTRNLEVLSFVYTQSQFGQSIILQDVLLLLEACRSIKWQEGVMFLIQSQATKNQFVTASFNSKLEFFKQILTVEFIQDLVPKSHDEYYLQKSQFTKNLKMQVYDFPYVSVIWTISTPLLENQFDFQRYIDIIGKNFTLKSVHMLDSLDQVFEAIDFVTMEQNKISSLNQSIKAYCEQKMQEFQEQQQDGNNLLRETEALHNQLQDITQQMQDIDHKIKDFDTIFGFQNQIIKFIKGSDIRLKGDFQELCQSLVEDILFPAPEDQQIIDMNQQTFMQFKEVLDDENIVYLQSMTGFDLSASYMNDELPHILKPYQKELECIDLTKLNAFHWIICSNREDLMNYVLDTYFKAGQKSVDFLNNSSQDCPFEAQAIYACLRGEQDTSEMYKVVDYQLQVGAQQEPANQFTFQIKGGGQQDIDVEFSDEISERRQIQLQIKIQNIGLVLLILSKNLKALKKILGWYPTIFQRVEQEDLQKIQQLSQKEMVESDCDILNSILLCATKQWNLGVNVLLELTEISFSRVSMSQKFSFVYKLFAIMKHYKNQHVQSCCESILSLQKIQNYISWQGRSPQFEMMLESTAFQMFTKEAQEAITGFNSMSKQNGAEDSIAELVAEMEELLKVMKNKYHDAMASSLFQSVIQKANQHEKYIDKKTSKKGRNFLILQFQIQKLIDQTSNVTPVNQVE